MGNNQTTWDDYPPSRDGPTDDNIDAAKKLYAEGMGAVFPDAVVKYAQATESRYNPMKTVHALSFSKPWKFPIVGNIDLA